MSYFGQLCKAMGMLAQEKGVIFLGQGVGCPGTTMSDTLREVPSPLLLEMPVAEELQAGMAIGMALGGRLPICIYPRWNFVLCAANQIVNHLDRIPIYSSYTPKVIIRTAVPSDDPFDPGPQHSDDFTDAFKKMLKTVEIYRLSSPDLIVPSYRSALTSPFSAILVEYTDLYKNERGNK